MASPKLILNAMGEISLVPRSPLRAACDHVVDRLAPGRQGPRPAPADVRTRGVGSSDRFARGHPTVGGRSQPIRISEYLEDARVVKMTDSPVLDSNYRAVGSCLKDC